MGDLGSMRAQKLAEDLLGLDLHSGLPQHASYSGKFIDGMKNFYVNNKTPIMIVGGVVIVGLLGWWIYKRSHPSDVPPTE